ncbi:hypothetical protein HWV62_8751 [Athelia sp. TMB]|nr:hypothetical protein HWV62_8751 [Athelia sp. TMB]
MAARSGLSRRTKVSIGRTFAAPTTSSQGPHGREDRLALANATRNAEISLMSNSERQDLLDSSVAIDHDVEMDDGGAESDTFMHPPPGTEGAGHSHAGDEEMVSELGEDSSQASVKDTRIRSDRTLLAVNHWQRQMPRLVDAYLHWRSNPLTPSPVNPDSPPVNTVPLPQRPATPEAEDGEDSNDEAPLVSDAPSGEGDFLMQGVDTFDYGLYQFSRPPLMVYTNEGLIHLGFIGSSPLYPTIAISIRTLEDYRQTHRVCPRLSIQASVRKLCHVHNRPFHRHLSRQFSDAFDVYLEILHQVDLGVAAALGRDSEDWELKNACPCCMYELEGEEPLEHRILATMDGNNSLKLVDESFRRGLERTDNRVGRSSKWLSPAYVNQYKDEVASHNKKGATADELDGDDEWLDAEMGVPDGRFTTQQEDVDNPMPGVTPTQCTKRWKNAGPEGQKKIAKYPLAMVAKILELLGDDNVLGYDIGCAFSQTVATSTLGARAAAQRLKFVVPSFHGHAHNRPCQLDYHPQYIPSLGIEDFETCERCFSLSNSVAPTTRLATKFHRQQAIEAHFNFQDEDKYAALSTFIYNNYQQSLDTIASNVPIVEQACLDLDIGLEDFDRYLDEERNYLANLKVNPLANTLHLDYVKALDNLTKFRAEATIAAAANTHAARDRAILRGAIGKDLTKLQRNQSTTYNRVVRAEDNVSTIEINLGITESWTASSPDYIRIKEYITNRKYLRAVDSLEALVVQRLFELTKMNHSGTAYKQRTLIAKALRTRSRAIGTALANYNRLAKTLDPPREDLDFQEVLLYSSLAEFDLLRDTRNTVQTRVWAQPKYRAAMACHFKVRCAHNELKRANAEITRLRTFMRDEAALYHSVITQLRTTNPGLSVVLAHRWDLRAAVNCVHKRRLDDTADLKGYTGSRTCGTRVGGLPAALEDGEQRGIDLEDEEDDIEDDVFQDGLNSLTDYVASAM